MTTPDADERLAPLRTRIDALDRQLIGLLNERAEIVVEIGHHKRALGAPIYAPDREAQVLARVSEANEGPLGDRAIAGIYRELMSGSFAIERPLRIGYLGPAGSFSHAAAVRQFGSSVDYEDLHEIAGVFTEVRRGHVDYGLVPIENSTGGGIAETLEAFRDLGYPRGRGTRHRSDEDLATGGAQPASATDADQDRGELEVCAEVVLRVRHNLLANCAPNEIRRIHSKPEVFAQCRRWVRTQFPRAELIAAASSSRAAGLAAEAWAAGEIGEAAIGSRLAGELNGLTVLFESIEDAPENLTRFFVLSTQTPPAPTGGDKTALMFDTADESGALARVLGVFADAGINLSHIDKRPRLDGRVWSYTFFVDAQGHREQPGMAAALERAGALTSSLTVLGSFPAARHVL